MWSQSQLYFTRRTFMTQSSHFFNNMMVQFIQGIQGKNNTCISLEFCVYFSQISLKEASNKCVKYRELCKLDSCKFMWYTIDYTEETLHLIYYYWDTFKYCLDFLFIKWSAGGTAVIVLWIFLFFLGVPFPHSQKYICYLIF